MIQLCKYIIPASRAHPSVSTTRLAPKHPQRCVGVLWAKTGRLLLIASTWIRKPRKVCMSCLARWKILKTCFKQACGTRLSWWHACRIQKVHFHFHTLKRFKEFKSWHTRPGNLVQATSATTVETKTLAGKSPGLVWKPAFRKHIQ